MSRTWHLHSEESRGTAVKDPGFIEESAERARRVHQAGGALRHRAKVRSRTDSGDDCKQQLC